MNDPNVDGKYHIHLRFLKLVRLSTVKLLTECLEEIKVIIQVQSECGIIHVIGANNIDDRPPLEEVVSESNLNELIDNVHPKLIKPNQPSSLPLVYGQDIIIDIQRIVFILLPYMSSNGKIIFILILIG